MCRCFVFFCAISGWPCRSTTSRVWALRAKYGIACGVAFFEASLEIGVLKCLARSGPGVARCVLFSLLICQLTFGNSYYNSECFDLMLVSACNAMSVKYALLLEAQIHDLDGHLC